MLWAIFMILIFALPVMVLEDMNLSFSFFMKYAAEYSDALFGMSLPAFIVFNFFYFLVSSMSSALAVSYTHLDVYKRQAQRPCGTTGNIPDRFYFP